MKKFFAVAVMALGLAASVSAQPRAIGARFTFGGEISYQHGLGSNFLQADLGWSDSFFALHGSYNFMIANPSWTEGTWGFFAGPGIGAVAGNDYAGLGVGAMVGLEYTLPDIPLQFSLDVRPDVLRITNDGLKLLGGLYPALGIRYAF